MKTKLFWLFSVAAIVLALSCTDVYAYYYDYCDAPGYAWAWNRGKDYSHAWQWLGQSWTSEGTSDPSSQPAPNDPSDDGVWWSTDGGSYYGHESVILGQTIWFKLDAHEYSGNHWTDYVRMWVDWNGNNIFDDSERILNYTWADTNGADPTDLTITFSTIVPQDAQLGTTWLRARIACSPMGAYGNHTQGECEDWPIEITTTEIPEPMSIGLLSFGLLSLGGIKIRKKKKL